VSTRASPTIRRRRLGGQLRRLREAAGLNIDQVANVLGCSTSKVSRIETGRVGLKPGELHGMFDIYKLGDNDRQALIQLAKEARQKSPLRARGISANLQMLIDLEIAATSIRTFGGLLLPGLLQTEGYARAVISALTRDLPSEELEKMVNLRLTRQALLTGDDPPSYWAIIDDAALRRPVGNNDIITEQLRQLVDVASLRNVTLQILPSSMGAHAGLCGEFTLFSFSEPTDQDIVYLEHSAGAFYLEQLEDLVHYAQVFDYLRAEALAPRDSISALASYIPPEAEISRERKEHA